MTVHWTSGQVTLLHGDVLAVLREMPAESVHCVVTSPPYWRLRDYGIAGQIGLEESPEAYASRMVEVFREVRRVLRADGTLWLNLGDSYAANRGYQVTDNKHRDVGNEMPMAVPVGLKPKDLIGIPWRVALALQADGWWLRSEITWCKRAPMPESVTDRPTSATEKVFLLAKSERYFYDADAVREEATRGYAGSTFTNGKTGINGLGRVSQAERVESAGRNQRNWWLLGPEPYAAAHFATFPTEIPRRAILAGTSERGCCANCGAPWVRLVEREAMEISRSDRRDQMGVGGRTQTSGTLVSARSGLNKGDKAAYYENAPRTTTTGWRPTCDHEAPTVPCTVLDPFVGSGTTCMVATQLGRHSIGIDLNAEYLELAVRRNQQMGLELPA